MIYRDLAGGWSILTQEERYWFGRLFLEAIFWNNYADASWLPDKNTIPEDNRPIGTTVFRDFSREIRDAILWRILICACYEKPQAESAIEESGIVALIHILEELVQEEIDCTEDIINEPEELELNREFIEYHYTRYRNLVISIVTNLGKDSEDEFNEELKLNSLTNSQILKLNDWHFWINYIDLIEIKFTPYDSDYSFPEDILAEERSFFTIEKDYFNQKSLLGELQKKINIDYWDLLFCCLEKRPLPELNELEEKKRKGSILNTVKYYLNAAQIDFLRENLFTNAFIL